MRIFWLDIEIRRQQGGAPFASVPTPSPLPEWKSKVQTVEEAKSVAYGTRYQSYDGTLIDGKTIVRNNAMYYKMYRVNTDIRAAIKAIRRTSMRDGYEYRKEVKTTGDSKVVPAPYFDAAIKASGGMRKVKNEIIKNFQLYGNVYILKIYNPVWVKEFKILDSRKVSIVTDKELVPLRYIYQNPAKKGATDTYPAQDIIHIVDDQDMDNPLFGISQMETLVIDVLGDEEANMSNYAYFTNDGIPSAVYILKAGMTPEAQDQVFEQITNTLKGGRNKHKSIVSDAVEDVKTISDSHTDADFTKQRSGVTEKVCAAMWVPRTQLGYVEDVNHSNGESQYTQFIEDTIRPMEEILEEIFNTLMATFQEYAGIKFVVNDEHIDSIGKKSELAQKNTKAGLWTINEGRDYIGYENSEDEIASELIVDSNRRLLSDLVNGTDPQAVQPTATDANPQDTTTGK